MSAASNEAEDPDNFNQVSIFRDENAIRRLSHRHIIQSSMAKNERKVDKDAKQTTDENIVSFLKDTYFYLNLKKTPKLLKTVCSFLVTITSQLKDNNFNFFLSKIQFFLFEYQNSLAALVSLYSFSRSNRYLKQKNILKDALL